MTYLCCLNVALLEDLLQDLILVCGAELVLEGALARCVEDALGAVADVRIRAVSSEAELEQTYLSVTKTLKPLTTCARGMLESCFQFWTASELSTKTTKSSVLPL